MTSDAELRRVTHELMAELAPALAAARSGAAAPTPQTGNGHDPSAATNRTPTAAVPQVPPPPVAAVLRPSTWPAPTVAGELVGVRVGGSDGDRGDVRPDTAAPATPTPDRPAPAPLPGERRTEVVAIQSDEDLERFVRALMSRLENPRDRLAIRTGRLRFVLDRVGTSSAVAAASAPEMRVERGAVTERVVRRAADERARLVLAPAAVLTPLARELAGSLQVEIRKEPRC